MDYLLIYIILPILNYFNYHFHNFHHHLQNQINHLLINLMPYYLHIKVKQLMCTFQF